MRYNDKGVGGRNKHAADMLSPARSLPESKARRSLLFSMGASETKNNGKILTHRIGFFPRG